MTMFARHRLPAPPAALALPAALARPASGARVRAVAVAVAVAASTALGLAGGLAAVAGAAESRAACAPGQAHAPHLTSPCDGATVARGRAITFTVVDPDVLSAAHGPYLNLQTTRSLVDGHLALNRNANGIFAQMTPVPGRPHAWTYTAARQLYASWWDNRRGIDYIQVEQVDPGVASGILYGPITTVHVR